MRGIRVVAVVLLAALAVAGGVVALAATDTRSAYDGLAIVLALTAYAAVAVAIELARPGHPVGRLVLVGALLWGVGEGLLALGLAGLETGLGAPGAALAGVLGTACRGAGWLLLVLGLPLLFPDGRPPGPRSVGLVAGSIAAFTLATLVAPTPLESRLDGVDNPIGVPESARVAADLLAIGSLLATFVALVVVVRSLVVRWRTGAELERQQVAIFGAAFSLPLLLLPVISTPWAAPWMFALVLIPTPVAVGVAMFQRRLYDVQRAANRTLTYVALSVVLAGVYAAVVAGVGVVLDDRGATWLPWAGAGVVAVAFAPVRDWLQQGVNRLTYGRWSTPAEVLADTGRRLADAADAPTLLRSLTDELVTGLGLARAEIHDASGRVLAASGQPVATTGSVPLTAYGQGVGSLRWAGSPLRPVHRSLLLDLAHQVGATVHTAGLVDSLRHAREQLVLGREQERRRLRRDLHDGLGPSLAGLGLHVDAAANLLAAGQSPDTQLQLLREGLGHTVAEVRRVVEGLRPPAVDDLGLSGAIAELGRELTGGAGLDLALELPEDRPALPAAVEVAAYRVAQEALTNVVRHAHAEHCRVRVCVEAAELVLTVADDGHGGAAPGRGVGLGSMAERAQEIGGSVQVTSDTAGTTVVARFPVHEAVGP
ncbi:sensor histidine kinase [Nocardioides coralli]|uniref:sensor histidine kinase n=1 Tax=Nocardioides coralli TaxID=2872154 RepID=UPI001CA3E119|nr:sensor histidine kinase [Nocardioides coralli]QZY29670.1 sensor histidine kinase [Nocardioides coralli]